MAEELNRSKEEIDLYASRAMNYRNVFDPETHVVLNLFSKGYKVSLTQSLVGYLDENDIKYSIA